MDNQKGDADIPLFKGKKKKKKKLGSVPS